MFSQCGRIFRPSDLSTEGVTITQILARVERNHAKLRTFKGNAQVSIETRQMQITATGMVAIQMPDLLKLDLKAGFGMTLGSLLLQGSQISLFSPMEKAVYKGDAHAFQQQRVFPIDLASIDMFHMAAGIPVINRMVNDSLSIDDGKYMIISYQPSGRFQYWIDPQKYVVTDVELYDNSNVLIGKQEFRQFSKEKGVYLPRLIRVQHTKGKERVTFFYNSRATNQKIKNEVFLLNYPESTRHIQLPINQPQ